MAGAVRITCHAMPPLARCPLPNHQVWDPATPDDAPHMTTTRPHPAGWSAWMGDTLQYYPFIMALPRGESP